MSILVCRELHLGCPLYTFPSTTSPPKSPDTPCPFLTLYFPSKIFKLQNKKWTPDSVLNFRQTLFHVYFLFSLNRCYLTSINSSSVLKHIILILTSLSPGQDNWYETSIPAEPVVKRFSVGPLNNLLLKLSYTDPTSVSQT